MTMNDGGSNPEQYALPEDATELQDLIEYRNMNYAIGNIFKACYRLGKCGHSDKSRDLNKILWFVQRELDRIDSSSPSPSAATELHTIIEVAEKLVEQVRSGEKHNLDSIDSSVEEESREELIRRLNLIGPIEPYKEESLNNLSWSPPTQTPDEPV